MLSHTQSINQSFHRTQEQLTDFRTFCCDKFTLRNPYAHFLLSFRKGRGFLRMNIFYTCFCYWIVSRVNSAVHAIGVLQT